MTTPRPEAWVYDGTSPQDLHAWCTNHAGPGSCNYVWGGMNWHVTVRTVNGHEVVHYGDAVQAIGDGQLTVVRKAASNRLGFQR